MAPTVIGNGLTTALGRKDSPSKRITPQGVDYVYRKTVKSGTNLGLSFGDANPDAAYTATVLKEINWTGSGPGGGYETVELVYGYPVQGDPSTPPVGTVIQECDCAVVEIPPQKHPSYNDSLSVKDEAGNLITPYIVSLKPGVEAYQVPVPTYTRTEILTSFTFSEANIISAVGTRNAPTGMTSPTANKWLKTRLAIRKQGNVIEKTETWQAAGRPGETWDTDIYG